MSGTKQTRENLRVIWLLAFELYSHRIRTGAEKASVFYILKRQRTLPIVLHGLPPPLPPCFIQITQESPTFPFLVCLVGEAMTSLCPLPSVETRYATRQPTDTSGTFHGTPWLCGEPFSPTWPCPVRVGPVPQETCTSTDPASTAAGGPKSKPQVRSPWA